MIVKDQPGGAVESQNEATQVNDPSCKVLRHSICVPIPSVRELVIVPEAWSEAA